MEDELSLDDLDQVGTKGFDQLNDFMTAFEQGDMQRVVQMGPILLGNAMFSDNQRAEIAKMVDQAKQVLSHKEETKGFGL